MLKQKNSKKQGDVGLGAAISYFTRLGYTVCLPLTDSQPYDLVIDNGENLQRVQVKTTTHKGHRADSYVVELRTTGGNKSCSTAKKFDPNLVDLVFVVDGLGRLYLIPASEIKARAQMTVGEHTQAFQLCA